MKTTLILVGKTTDRYLDALIADYVQRIRHYMTFDVEVIPDLRAGKSLTQSQQREQEGRLILQHLRQGDYLLLLDERGREMRSVEWAEYLGRLFCQSYKRLVFVVGGPYGFSQEVYDRCQGKISLSRMTFSHQMIRLIFTEQVYRALTILHGEPYHHE
ncbi:MAG: 23S rRNA (pseudouridine(1915)-N(3))-methyltransferase RlmH [Prevotellaceae bacterium]|nr:23S rRNA (pseudouridine(1915)-N(3))-methyltransferase RlmH [Prevotellaceae bacterium]MDY3855516.1 23S rRNA (pseudouridine(1915)-N(3))-methyltransferase RlmH [Bacteroidaceae bacterium]